MVLNKSPAFILTQLGWTPENIDDMVKADGNKVVVKYAGDFSSAFVLNVLASRPASVVDAVTVQANEANGDMGNAWLKANSAGTGAVLAEGVPPGRDRATSKPTRTTSSARRPSRASSSATWRRPRPSSCCCESGDVDIAKNLTPDQIAGLAGKDSDQGRDLSAGRRALPVLQPEGRRRCSPRRSGKPPAISSTTRA